MKAIYRYEYPIVTVWIGEEDGAISYIKFHDNSDYIEGYTIGETPLIKKAAVQLSEYFDGERTDFNLPLKLRGTDFQKSVWKALIDIPYGETRSYKDIAIKVGSPKAFRAVGMANNRNPISIIIPCHRVIGHNGKLVGYGGGLSVKEFLLDLEKRNMNS
ncbi:MAG: methylated-DNA--[protein]-cysteine S-methyltransferase [Clostridiales bacterium]|nr:methylated-DNA--[protein]-cysteine S-methyltransferase [Clostridiales bacterium]